MNDLIRGIYIVPGLPHILLSKDQNEGWQRLHQGFETIRKEIEASGAEMILYFSTQWFSVLGTMFQYDPKPEGFLCDPNWYDLGTMHYRFTIDQVFTECYEQEVRQGGGFTRLVNYKGFPIDAGTIVAQKLLNPHNTSKAAMVSCNIYHGPEELLALGEKALQSIQKLKRKTAIVLVSGLSNRFHTDDITPSNDHIHSQVHEAFNQELLATLSAGELSKAMAHVAAHAGDAEADMGFKGLYWLKGLIQERTVTGQTIAYEPVWGTGAAVLSLKLAPQDTDQKKEIKHVDPHTLTATTKTLIHAELAAKPVGPYPHGRKVGSLFFMSGIGPRRPGMSTIPGVTQDSLGHVIDHDIKEQTRAVFANIKAVLEEASLTLAHIVDVQVFLTDMQRDFKDFNQVYGDIMGDLRPTRTTVGVTSLPTPIHVELKIIASYDL